VVIRREIQGVDDFISRDGPFVHEVLLVPALQFTRIGLGLNKTHPKDIQNDDRKCFHMSSETEINWMVI